jgi:hypothetical protein
MLSFASQIFFELTYDIPILPIIPDNLSGKFFPQSFQKDLFRFEKIDHADAPFGRGNENLFQKR